MNIYEKAAVTGVLTAVFVIDPIPINGPGVVQQPSIERTVDVDLGVLPDQVPAEVATHESDSVTVDTSSLIIDKSGAVSWEDNIGSGVRLGSRTYVTAGHVLLNNKGQPLEGSNYCRSLFVDETSFLSPKQYAPDTSTIEYRGGILDDTQMTKLDVGLLLNVASDPPKTQPLTTQFATAVVGEPLIAVNDEPTAQGKMRDPIDYHHQSAEPDVRYTSPAVYGGVVIAKMADGKLLVAEGLHSYGVVPDDHARPGASGGAEYNEAGQLVGISVDIAVNPVSQQQLASEYGITAINAPKTIYLTYVQPVTQALLNRLATRLIRCNPDDPPTAAEATAAANTRHK